MANALPATSEGKAQLFYVAYYGRPADPLGLAYWAGVIDAAGGDLSAVSANFGNSEEANAVYGGLSTAAAVNKLYNQMFNRDAEPAGLAFWVGEINAGRVALSDLPLALFVGAQGTDLDAFVNKWTVASAFTDALDTTPEILAYNGIPAMAGAADLLATVGSDDASVAAAVAQIDKVIADIGAAPDTTQSLTTGIDDLKGGAGFDRFNGGTSTLTLGDSIDGGAGNDELNLTLAGNGGEAGDGLYAGFTVKNVETINLRAIGTQNEVELEMTGVDGLKTLNILRSTNEVYIRDLQDLVDVNLDDVGAHVGIDFDNQLVAGSDDALNLTVREVGNTAGGYGSIEIDRGIEVLNIEDRGSDGFESDFDLYGGGLEQIVITGGDEYTQTPGAPQDHLSIYIDTDGNGASLDSTGFAGDLYAYTTQWDVNTIRNGAGDDVIIIDSDWGVGATMDTGAGDDTVVIYGEDYYGNAAVDGSIVTGDGNDEVYVYNYDGYYYGGFAVGETGVIDTGNGDDYVWLDGGIQGDVSDDGVAGQVLLGSGDDTLVISGEDYYYYDYGTNDINGVVDAGAGDDLIQVYNGTVGDGGVVMGGPGNDELQLWNSMGEDYYYYYDERTTVVTNKATITGIETLSLGNTDYDDSDLDHQIDLDAFDDALTTVNIINASTAGGYADQYVILTNVTDEQIRITSTDSDSGDDVELDVSLKDGSGDDDTLSVELFGTSAKFEVELNDTADNIEHLALQNNGSGNREVDTSYDFDESLTVTGDSTSNLRVFNSTSLVVDASAYAGNFTIEVADDGEGGKFEQDYKILTGSGNDTINLLNDVFSEDDTIDGGAGVDRLIVNQSTADGTSEATREQDEVFNNVRNVEELEVRGADAGPLYVTLDDDAYAAGIERLIVEDDDGEQANVDLLIGADFDRGLRIDHNNGVLVVNNEGAVDLDIHSDVEGGRTLVFTDASNGGDVDLTITIGSYGEDTFIDSWNSGAGWDGYFRLDVEGGSVDSITLLDNVNYSGEDNGEVYISIEDSWNTQSNGGPLVIDASDIANDDNNSATGGVFVDAAGVWSVDMVGETSARIEFTGSANDDGFYGGAMADTVILGDGNDYAYGNAGNDMLSGGNGNDTLDGGAGNDTIDGGAGNDHITGGLGKDLLTGGAGNDIFYFNSALDSNGLNIDVITDFNLGNDTISLLSSIVAGGALTYVGEVQGYGAVLTALTAGSGTAQAVLDQNDSRLYVDLDNNGILNDLDLVITLTGVTDLDQLDFAVHA